MARVCSGKLHSCRAEGRREAEGPSPVSVHATCLLPLCLSCAVSTVSPLCGHSQERSEESPSWRCLLASRAGSVLPSLFPASHSALPVAALELPTRHVAPQPWGPTGNPFLSLSSFPESCWSTHLDFSLAVGAVPLPSKPSCRS